MKTKQLILRQAAYQVLSQAGVLLAHVEHTMWAYAVGKMGEDVLTEKERAYLAKTLEDLKLLSARHRKLSDRLRHNSTWGQ